MLRFFKKPIIEFYCHPEIEGVIPEPKPAGKFISEWYKKIPPVIKDERGPFGDASMTAKKCLPMLDAMTLGYVITTQSDFSVRTNHDNSEIEIFNSPEIRAAEFHSLAQVGNNSYPGYPGKPIKFINNWVIKTAPGWSTLFLPLINNFDNPEFTCLSGFVDTDKYPKEVNFPAIWNAPNYDNCIKAGTPLVVAIPIKRTVLDQFPPIRKMTKKEFKDISILNKKQNSRAHVYTKELREPRR
jgi:Family of unknown function (DUF6065)